MYFGNARHDESTSGRFISTDPTGFGGGNSNLYGYVSNDPANFTDPSGLSPKANGRGPDSWGIWGDPNFYQGLENGALKAGGILLLALVAPEVVISVAAGYALYDFLNRYNIQGQTVDQSGFGTLADLTGFNGIWAGVNGTDIASGRDLGLNAEQRGEALAGGVVGWATFSAGGIQLLDNLTSAVDLTPLTTGSGATTSAPDYTAIADQLNNIVDGRPFQLVDCNYWRMRSHQ